MTSFAGTLTGPITQRQVFALGEWVPVITRGGEQNPDAIFAPTIKTPWTDDLQIGYQVELAPTMSFEVLYTRRRTRNIVEDYELSLYAFRDDGTTNYPGPVDHPDSLFLGLDYFGYDSFPDLQLRHCHAGRCDAELPGRGARLPQTLQRPLAAFGRLHL